MTEEDKEELYKIWADSGLWRKWNFYDWLIDLYTLIAKGKNNTK